MNFMKNIFLCLLFSCIFSIAFCQRPLTQDLKLTDGLYQHIGEFKQDAPSLSWKEYEGIWTYNARLKCYQVEKIHRKGKPEINLQDTIWGFTLKGVPYIRVSPDSSGRPLTLFAELTVRGLINTFFYEKENQEMIPMKAYNPLTGTVFRKGMVKRKTTTLEKRIFNLNDNQILNYDPLTLEKWIEKDKEILRALRLASNEEYEEKLIRALIVFNSRYPFIIQK